MKKLDLALLLSLFAAFIFSSLGFASGDLSAGLVNLSLTVLLATMNIINLLIDIRNELRRRKYEDLGH